MKSTKQLARELGLLRKRSCSAETRRQRQAKTRQLFAYLIVLDFESTCWEDAKHRTQEIIEFPAVLMKTATGHIVSEFHYYIMPQENPILSPFCMKLTGISQDQVEEGIPLALCISKFRQWLTKISAEHGFVYHTSVNDDQPRCTFVTWSDWDLGVCLQYEARRKQLRKPAELNSWIDLRATYRKFYERKPKGLNGALQDLGLDFEGREHSGIVDALNTARLAYRMICDGCLLVITKSLEGLIYRGTIASAQLPVANKISSPGQKCVIVGMTKADKAIKGAPVKSASGDGSKLSHPSERFTNICNKASSKQVNCVKIVTNTTTGVGESSNVDCESVHTKWDSSGKNCDTNIQDSDMSSCATSEEKCETILKKYCGTQTKCEMNQLKYDAHSSGEDSLSTVSSFIPNVPHLMNRCSGRTMPHSIFTGVKRSSSTTMNLQEQSSVVSTPTTSPKAKKVNFSRNMSSFAIHVDPEQTIDKANLRIPVGSKMAATSCAVKGSQFRAIGVNQMSSVVTSTSSMKTPQSISRSKMMSVSSFCKPFKTPFPVPLDTPGFTGMKRTPPMCTCGRRAKRKYVQNPGPNLGRAFFCCGATTGRNSKLKSCNFFKWEPDENSLGASPFVRQKPNNTGLQGPCNGQLAFKHLQQPDFNTPQSLVTGKGSSGYSGKKTLSITYGGFKKQTFIAPPAF